MLFLTRARFLFLSVAALIKWQKVDGVVTQGYDYLRKQTPTLLECQEWCLENQPRCRSVEYFQSTYCNLNDVVFGDPGIYTWFSVSSGTYYGLCELGESLSQA